MKEIIIAILLMGAAAIGWSVGKPAWDRSQIEKAATAALLDNLISPGSAKIVELAVEKQTASTYLVRGSVDSQNSMGALLRNNFAIIVKKTKSGWSSTSSDVLLESR